MTVGSIGNSYFNPYVSAMGTYGTAMSRVSGAQGADSTGAVVNPGESTQVAPGRKSSPAECETCKNRKYQDGSDEMVSFKSPAHISPESSGAKVRAHEQEHVANAYTKAAKMGGKVQQASVKLETSICPECGRSYVSGGLTTTKISYKDDKYSQNKKSYDAQGTVGANFDKAV